MFGPPGASTTSVFTDEPEPALFAAEAVGAAAAVAVGETLARIELACSGVIVVVVVLLEAAAEALGELESEGEDELEFELDAGALEELEWARLLRSSGAVSMNAMVGPATRELVAWSRMLFARGWPSEVM